MKRVGLPLNVSGLWEKRQLFPRLQKIVKKYGNHAIGKPGGELLNKNRLNVAGELLLQPTLFVQNEGLYYSRWIQNKMSTVIDVTYIKCIFPRLRWGTLVPSQCNPIRMGVLGRVRRLTRLFCVGRRKWTCYDPVLKRVRGSTHENPEADHFRLSRVGGQTGLLEFSIQIRRNPASSTSK